jgi:hypothetical protein
VADVEAELQSFGSIEEAPGGVDRMVIRLVGRRVGTAGGWIHLNGWCVIAPEFLPEEGIEHIFKEPVQTTEHLGLLIDFYSGEIALVRHTPRETGEGKIEQVLQKSIIPTSSVKEDA